MSTLLDFSAGVATGDNGKTLSGRQIVNSVTAGRTIETITNPESSITITFPEAGDRAFRLLPSQDCLVNFSGGNLGEMQVITIFIQQPPTGNCDITWGSNITWTGKTSFVDSQFGVVSCFEIMWDGLSKYYGRMIFG